MGSLQRLRRRAPGTAELRPAEAGGSSGAPAQDKVPARKAGKVGGGPPTLSAQRSAQTPNISMTIWATLRPEYCCWPVTNRPSRMAKALNSPAET